MRTFAAASAPFFFVVFALGCSQDAETMPPDTTELDAGADALPTPDAMSPTDAALEADAGTDATRADAGTDARGVELDAAGDASSTVDATPDADAGAVIDATREASAPDAPAVDVVIAPDAPDARDAATTPDADAATPSIDAGTDASDAPTVVPVCDSPMPACQRAIESDELIRATFPQPCAPEGDRKCGGVWRGVVETLPMICRNAQWRLAGSWTGIQWSPLYTCSQGCGAAGVICNP